MRQFALVLAVVLLISQLTFAQEEYEMEEVVITATKTEKLLKDVPVRTEVITSEEIEAKGAVTLYEALEGIPGVRIEQQCSYCNFSIVRMQGLEAGHVQVLIDGQPLYSGLAGVYGLQQVPAANIERIEIIKGASSALYGSSAIAGVINIITKKPGKEPMVEVMTSFGTDGTNVYTVAASTRAENMDVMLTVQKNTGNEIDEDGDGLTDRVKTDNVGGGVRINLYDVFIDDDTLTFSGRTLNESRAGGELATFANPFSASAENIDTTRYETVINYKRELLYGDEIEMSIAYCTHERNATNDSFLGDYMATHDEQVPPVDIMRPYTADEKLYVLDANYAHPIGEKHKLLAGIQYSKNELDESGKYCIVDESDADYGKTYLSTSDKHADEVGVYLQDEIKLSDKLDLVVGGRYDTHSSKDSFAGSGDISISGIEIEYDEKAFNPRLALMYKPEDGTTVRASVGTGFRVPYGFSEDLHLCSGSPRVYKGADLEPEKSVSANLGIDWERDKYLLSLNVFRTNLEEKIGFADASDFAKARGYTYEWENIGDAYTQGIEVGLDVSVAQNLTLHIDGAFTDAQYDEERSDWVENHPEYAEDSKYIPRVPEITANVNLRYAPETWGFSLNCAQTGSMYVDYCAEDDITSADSKIKHTDPYWVVNAKIEKHFTERGLTAFIGVKNLLDEVQDEKHPDDAAFMYAPYTGRMIYGGMKVKF